MNIIITYFRKIETIQMKANLKINKRQLCTELHETCNSVQMNYLLY